MRTRTKALIGVGIAATIGSIALAGASYAERGHGRMGFFAKGQFGLIGASKNSFRRSQSVRIGAT